MINRLLFFSSLLISIGLSSCDFETKFETHTSDLGFAIEVPVYLTETDNLNKTAVAQFENQRKHVYLVIFEHPKEKFITYWKKEDMWDNQLSSLTNYSNSNIKDLNDFCSDGETKHLEEVNINGLSSTICKYEATVENERVLYYTASIEEEEHFYTVMAWTLVESESEFNNDFLKMLNSFSTTSN
jgi:hypothetical protein